MKKTLAWILSLMLMVTMTFVPTMAFAGTGDGADVASKVAQKSQTGKVLRDFALAGYFSKKIVNSVKMDKKVTVKVWDASNEKFAKGKFNSKTITGNFVKIADKNKNKKGDLVYVVKFEDSENVWDSGMQWLDGVGAKTEPVLSDEEGQRMFVGAEYRIPMGQRLLEGFGIKDYSGVTDVSNHFDGGKYQETYWPAFDYYNVKCSENLTILPHYKSFLQTIGTSCSLASATSVLEWYGERGDLNDRDLASLRAKDRKKFDNGTWLKELNNVFKRLGDLGITCKWTIESSYDNNREAQWNICDPEFITGHLEQGHPIMVGWNSFDSHEQVIIGYDDMGTKEDTADDVLIMMDPYDTTDHNADGYIIQSAERLMYGLSDYKESGFETVEYTVVYPAEETEWSYTIDRSGKGIADDPTNVIVNNDNTKLDAKTKAKTAADLDTYYKDAEPDWIGVVRDGVGGAWGVQRDADYDNSPYYNFFDFYNYKNGETAAPTKTLKMIENFSTQQQSTEWLCGCTSMLMVLDYYGLNDGEDFNTDASLSAKRQDGETGATFLKGMKHIVKKYNANRGENDPKLLTVDRNDFKDINSEESYFRGFCLQAGTDPEWYGFIPYCIENNVPVMIGSDEWGGHWQVIVGYDDMGTIDRTQDDVLVIADPYDTTDHDQDGYVIKGFERLVYGWNVQYEDWDGKYPGGFDHNDFIVAIPDEPEYADVIRTLGLK